jgi:hypothetical protein
MLKSYEAVYENGRITWLNDRPTVDSARVIVTVLAETALPKMQKRIFPAELVGKVEILGDIVSPIVEEDDWECLK